MASFKINTLAAPRAFTQIAELDDKSYLLSFRFNARDGKWRFTMTFEDVELFRNLPLIETADLTAALRHVVNLPPGTFQVVDLDGQGRDPDTDTFGDRVYLQYDEAA